MQCFEELYINKNNNKQEANNPIIDDLKRDSSSCISYRSTHRTNLALLDVVWVHLV